MQGSKRWWVLAAVAGVVALLLFLLSTPARLQSPFGEPSSAGGRSSGAARAGGEGGAGGEGTPAGAPGPQSERVDLAPPDPEFEAARVGALKVWRFELQNQLQTCMPTPGPDPHPLMVGFTMAYDPQLSTPALQRFVVMGIDLPPNAGPLSKNVQGCLNRAVGTSVNIPVEKALLPEVMTQLHDVIAFPL